MSPTAGKVPCGATITKYSENGESLSDQTYTLDCSNPIGDFTSIEISDNEANSYDTSEGRKVVMNLAEVMAYQCVTSLNPGTDFQTDSSLLVIF